MANAGIAGVAGIWQKLRRRKVVQWGIAYSAAAWGLLQGLEYGTTTFHWPQPIQQLATLALLIGLPIVLVLAWYHGDRGEQHFTRTELAIITLLSLLGGIIFWRYEPATDAAIQVDGARRAASSTTPTDPRPSIAVLPFENRSRVEDDAFFVDGIYNDILTQVSKMSALRVISRDSVERLRDAKFSTREIAEQLGVTSVLQGGVQRAGDRVRVHVQLIDASTDSHLWAENFDRELTIANLFAIQSEVASAIAGALQATLTPAERARMQTMPTKSMEAWEAYQLAGLRAEKRTSSSLAEAERLVEEAIGHDPSFALAYVGLANLAGLQIHYSGRSRQESIARGEALVKQALALQPDLPEAAEVLGDLAAHANDYKRAEAEYRRAIALKPNDVGPRIGLSGLLVGEEALREIEIALQLDPISPILIFLSTGPLMQLDRYDEALVRLRKAIAIDPEFPRSYEGISDVYRNHGRHDLSIPWREKAASLDPDNPYHPSALALQYLQLGEDAQAGRWLERALQHEHWGWGWEIGAMFSLYRGDHEAFKQRARKAAAIESFRIRWLVVGDLRRGDYPAARARFVDGVPELFVTKSLKSLPVYEADFRKVMATELAQVLQHTGEEPRARALLDLTEDYLKGSSTIDVVAIHALRGETSMALVKLREVAAASIYTSELAWQYHRDFDPRLESIRDEPEFKAFFAGVEAEMAAQRARLAARPKDAPLVIEQVAGLK